MRGETQPHESRAMSPTGKLPRHKCGAKNRRGGKCGRWSVPGRDRCDRHGGKTPRGEDSPHFKHGLRLRHLPPDLGDQLQDAQGDPDLLQIRTDLAEVEVLLANVHSRLKAGRPVPVSLEGRILNLIDARRKLIETEARRLRDLQLLVPGERFMAAMTAAADAIASVIRTMCLEGVPPGTDPAGYQDQVRRRFQQLRLPASIMDVEGERDR